MSKKGKKERANPFTAVEQTLEGAGMLDHPGDIERFVPEIDITQPIRALALEIGRLVAQRSIFRRNSDVVTVEEDTGEMRPMTGWRFPSWVEQYAAFKAPGARQKRPSLTVEDAKQVLSTDVFLDCLRPLLAVHFVRLPIQRSGGIELLPCGYDPESAIFTIDGLAYDLDTPLPMALEFFRDVFAEYPWIEFGGGDLLKNRSASLHVLSLLGVFCRGLFPPGTRRPMMLWIGNQVGTGKSILAAMPLLIACGEAASMDFPKREEELEKTLHTKAQTLAPYILFDDIGSGMFSNALNRFVTATGHTGRVMGGNKEEFRVPNVTQIFGSGNGVKLTPDLMRRSLIVELFLARDAKGRRFKRNITPEWILSDGPRGDFLSALWAIVREWIAMGMPKHESPLESFEGWTATFGGMVQAVGFADPLLPPVLPTGGDQESLEWRQLLVALADDAGGVLTKYSREAIVEKARDLEVLEDLVGSEGEPPLNSDDSKKFGKRIGAWKGRELVDSSGRNFQFAGHKRGTRGARSYPIEFLP